MKNLYSVYEAKAHLSRILRRVRERGESFTITYHGEPVAEIRPVADQGSPLERRLARLEETGAIVRATRRPELRTLERRPGALRRFLDDRGE